jgi:hypothetical protein
LLIFSKHITPRLQYVIRFIFEEFLGINTVITSDEKYFIDADQPKLSYAAECFKNEFNITPVGLLHEESIRQISPEFGKWNEIPVIFPVNKSSDLPFDLFSAVFFLLTRYEEYLHFKPDRYRRFPAKESICYRSGMLDLAVVDRWILRLYDLLKTKYPDLKPVRRSFRFIPTIDVDIPYEYRHKGILRCAGGALKSALKLEFKKVKERISVLTGKQKDPFYTFDRIKEMHPGEGLIIFILTAGYNRYDKGIHPGRKAFKEMVNEVSAFSHLGLHPSYHSNKDIDILEKELQALSHIAGKEITRSRQHYLKLYFPGTYRKLSELGISEDYSMGYPSHPGFRAGTCTPFYFYDLNNERETSLKIYPFQIMDRTLKDYLCLSPQETTRKISNLIKEVKNVNGTLITIWHNDSFSDTGEWEGWLEVYQKLLEYVRK